MFPVRIVEFAGDRQRTVLDGIGDIQAIQQAPGVFDINRQLARRGTLLVLGAIRAKIGLPEPVFPVIDSPRNTTPSVSAVTATWPAT